MPRWSIAAWTSARPSRRRELLARAPHHLIDLIDPAESYSAARFLADAEAAMAGDRGARADAAPGRRHDALLPRAAVGTRAPAGGRCPRSARGSRRARRRRAGRRCMRSSRALDPAPRAHPAGRPPAHPARARGHRADRPADLGAAAEDLRGATRAGDLRLVLAPADRAALYERIGAQLRRHDAPGPPRRRLRALRARGDLHAATAVDAADRLPPALGAPRGRERRSKTRSRRRSSPPASSPGGSSPGCAPNPAPSGSIAFDASHVRNGSPRASTNGFTALRIPVREVLDSSLRATPFASLNGPTSGMFEPPEHPRAA